MPRRHKVDSSWQGTVWRAYYDQPAKRRRDPGDKRLYGQKLGWWFAQNRQWRYLLLYHYRRAPGDADSRFLWQLWDAQEGRCCYCECALDDGNRVLEHMKPVSRGGRTSKENLAFACFDCNTRKHRKTYDEFLAAVGVTTAGREEEASTVGASKEASAVRKPGARMPESAATP